MPPATNQSSVRDRLGARDIIAPTEPASEKGARGENVEELGGGTDSADEARRSVAARLVVGLATLALGGCLATWLRPNAGRVMPGIATIVVAVLLMTMTGSAPPWYGFAFLVLGPLATLPGGALGHRRAEAGGRAV